MKPEIIKSKIYQGGASLTDVANVVGVSPSMVSAVVAGRAKSRKVAETIALFLNKTVDELWPGEYPETYRRRHQVGCDRLRLAFINMQARHRAAEQRSVASATATAEV